MKQWIRELFDKVEAKKRTPEEGREQYLEDVLAGKYASTELVDPYRIESLVVETGGAEFTGETFRQLCGPGVYMFMLGDLPLYVGMGGDLLQRCAQKAHRHAKTARAECNRVLIWPCQSEEKAKLLEELLICKLKPKYNGNGQQRYVSELTGGCIQARSRTTKDPNKTKPLRWQGFGLWMARPGRLPAV
jgi:hypothetical protein